jgi:hypothetical protein
MLFAAMACAATCRAMGSLLMGNFRPLVVLKLLDGLQRLVLGRLAVDAATFAPVMPIEPVLDALPLDVTATFARRVRSLQMPLSHMERVRCHLTVGLEGVVFLSIDMMGAANAAAPGVAQPAAGDLMGARLLDLVGAVLVEWMGHGRISLARERGPPGKMMGKAPRLARRNTHHDIEESRARDMDRITSRAERAISRLPGTPARRVLPP